MLSRTRLAAARIPSLRPLRPPATYSARPPRPRLFTQNSQLLLVSRNAVRPQLPYLAQPTYKSSSIIFKSSQQTIRFLSTETKQYVKEQAWLTAKWTAIIWTFLFLGSTTWYGINMEMDERAQPTPSEWTFTTRQSLRAARRIMSTERVDKVGFVPWGQVYTAMHSALLRLEDLEKEGKGLVPALGEGEELLIADVGKVGYDISGKSWPWRAGYFEVVMGCALAAEHLDDMVLDTTRRKLFPKATVIGPSNPDPRPVPPYMDAAPREENCVTPAQTPEVFYTRILTGIGFTTSQKLDAATAYAQWLQFKGLNDSADEMYRWAVDIAKAALPTGAASEEVIDGKFVVQSKPAGTSMASSNLLRATTNIAVHHARTGNVSSALPIFLSVLRARQTAPVAAVSKYEHPAASTNSSPLSTAWNIFQQPPFPPPPPSGDDPFTRSSIESTCDEAELMLYIGEILFASSPRLQEGLSWTRQAVDVADKNCKQIATDAKSGISSEEQKRCRECLVTGAQNWETMLRKSMEQQESITQPSRGWFGSRSGSANVAASPEQLDIELRDVMRLRNRIVSEGIEIQVARSRTSNPSGVWLG